MAFIASQMGHDFRAALWIHRWFIISKGQGDFSMHLELSPIRQPRKVKVLVFKQTEQWKVAKMKRGSIKWKFYDHGLLVNILNNHSNHIGWKKIYGFDCRFVAFIYTR